jgi:DUF1365 family protein
MHHRLSPKKHQFHYNVFMFYIDLDELDFLSDKLKLFSRNRFNIFSFRDSDHLELSGKTTKENLLEYLRKNGLTINHPKIMLMTNLRTFGHVFNPVSFYFVSDGETPVASVAEVGNTFGEIKPFLLGTDSFSEGSYQLRTTKYFYVSPFTDMDDDFSFHLTVPSEKLSAKIDTWKKGERYFISSLTGEKKPLTDGRLFLYSMKFPFITVKIIAAIHFQALILWMKKLPYHKKSDHLELQREVLNHGKFS